MNKQDYYNTSKFRYFLYFCSYFDHDDEMKAMRSLYRKKLKFIFRKAIKDEDIKNEILERLNRLQHWNALPMSYFQECINTFRMRYIEGISIAKILTWYREKENGVDLYESEIHRRINYIVDLLMIEFFGLDGIFPGISNYLESFPELNKIIESYES